MTSALAYKELRESAGVAGLGLVALFTVAAANMGLSPIPGLTGGQRHGVIPFLNDGFIEQFFLVAAALALGLGFKQSLGDFLGETQLFLLHRPITHARIYGTKLAVGLLLCLGLSGLAVLAYCLWAATPGTHASPFDWSMTTPAWTACLASTAVYLGAFLSGIRPAAWFGTRLAPMVAAAGLALLAAMPPVWASWPALVAFDALLMALILHVTATRDFA